MNAGLNLFTVRDFIQTEKDFLHTAERLKELGYGYLQYSGAAFDPGLIGRVSEQVGMPVVLTHVPMDRILGETEKLCAEHLSFGCKDIGLGMMPLNIVANEKLCKETIAKLDDAGGKMAKFGCKFFYHHHYFEFFKFADGQTMFDYMLANTQYINFTLDTYWLQYGGADVVDFVNKCKGRAECVHLKDYSVKLKLNAEPDKPEFQPSFAPVGGGTLDFKKIIVAMKKTGVEYFLVEQDDACSYPDPFGEVKKSIDYIKRYL